jgi:hypothetical protein
MKVTLGRLAVTAGTVAALVAVPSAASAQEKWFVEHAGRYATDWAFALRPITLGLIAAVVLATLAWRYVAVRFLPTPELRPLRFIGRLVPYVPRLLGVHLGVSLLAAAVSGHFLTHDLEVDDLKGGSLLLLVEGALGIWFIAGVRLRVAAAGLALAGPFGRAGERFPNAGRGAILSSAT